MNSILRICVPLSLRVVAQHTEILIVELDLTPNISKQPTFHDRVHYPLKLIVVNRIINLTSVQFNMSYTLKAHRHIN